MAKRSSRSKEEKEKEFIDAIEQLLGFPLMEWQIPWMLEVRRKSLAGEQIDMNSIEYARITKEAP